MGERKALSLLDQGPETHAKVQAWLAQFDTILINSDGVIWRFNKAIEGAPETVNRLKNMGKKIYIVTNNATKTRGEMCCMAKRHGINAVKEEIVSSGYLVVDYLKQEKFSGKVYVIGGSGLTRELNSAGIENFGAGPDVNTVSSHRELLTTIKIDPDVSAVVVSFDAHFSLPKIIRAASYLINPGCIFLGTNTDGRYPMIDKHIIVPLEESIVRCIESASGQEALCLGKPYDYMCKYLLENCELRPERTLMIGDKGNTDILLGTRCGFHTLLVLTGSTVLENLQNWINSSKPEDLELLPDFYVPKISDLLPFL